MTDLTCTKLHQDITQFLPETAHRYLSHTLSGKPIREIARDVGLHASTVLRQIRKLEGQREDPLVDRALNSEDAGHSNADTSPLQSMTDALRQLCKPGAMLLYSADAQQPAIVQTRDEGDAQVLCAVPVVLAAGLVLRNWMSLSGGTSVLRYGITNEGRSQLPKLVALQDVEAAKGDGETTAFTDDVPDRRSRDRSVSNGPGFESPPATLARRRGVDGKPFLKSEHVEAGERLFEDFTLAGFEDAELIGWETPEALDRHYAGAKTMDVRHSAAVYRTLDAIKDLGPGLSDVVLSCCCLREGLEATEKRMGWSARSGKVVLRIALQRLCQFYKSILTEESAWIG